VRPWSGHDYTAALEPRLDALPRSKPIAVLGERRVPLPLQHLHHRLLDEAIQHG
jgi:hypothetical protein